MEQEIENLQKENEILKEALKMYITWAEDCGIGWDNFPEEEEKYRDNIKELDYIDGLAYMVIEEAKLAIEKRNKNENNKT